jgi:hypothetical protein
LFAPFYQGLEIAHLPENPQGAQVAVPRKKHQSAQVFERIIFKAILVHVTAPHCHDVL